jgi:hypothetical protein
MFIGGRFNNNSSVGSDIGSCGFAAAQCGKAPPYRLILLNNRGYASEIVSEAQPPQNQIVAER